MIGPADLRRRLTIAGALVAGNPACARPSVATTAPASGGADADRDARAPESADTLFESAARSDDPAFAIADYTAYLQRFADDAAEQDRIVAAHLNRGRILQSLGDHEAARDDFAAAITQAEAREFEAASESADWPAEAQYRLATYTLAELRSITLDAEGDALAERTQALLDALQRSAAAYDAVLPWRRVLWALAAVAHRGEAFEIAANVLARVPIPDEIADDPKAVASYEAVIQEQLQPLRNKALQLYRACVEQAEGAGVRNEHTEFAAQRLAAMRASTG
jgi:hypothetical protein